MKRFLTIITTVLFALALIGLAACQDIVDSDSDTESSSEEISANLPVEYSAPTLTMGENGITVTHAESDTLE
ncbi:MAG: hypothetical protein J6Z34_06755, partial [Clostridia bacterium]|nr:hypothetical protein [Clostridia bacterium]MBP5373116.1 hypothetical protein [Clostridia bacterium]